MRRGIIFLARKRERDHKILGQVVPAQPSVTFSLSLSLLSSKNLVLFLRHTLWLGLICVRSQRAFSPLLFFVSCHNFQYSVSAKVSRRKKLASSRLLCSANLARRNHVCSIKTAVLREKTELLLKSPLLRVVVQCNQRAV